MGVPHFMDVWRAYVAGLNLSPLDKQLIRVSDMEPNDDRHFAPTVYMHVLDGKLMYVGQSVNAPYRRRQHAKSRRWDDEYVLVAPDDMYDYPLAERWMSATETALIQHFLPPLNLRQSAGGLVSQDICTHIKNHGFQLPNGITVGEPHVHVVRIVPKR